jgi:cytoskeletal protein RodZ
VLIFPINASVTYNGSLPVFLHQEATMSPEFSSLGETFKVRRKERNLSLKEVENATSIRVQYLQAIEDGQMEKLISPIYAQGFVKQYASFLELDTNKIFTEYADVLKQPIQQEFAYGIGTLEMRGNPGSSAKWMPSLLWIVAFGLLAAAAVMFAKTLGLF